MVIVCVYSKYNNDDITALQGIEQTKVKTQTSTQFI